ncbi:fused MFS/spermidine synthase [Candidatus Uabimicrobium amorphum]|uniref:Spermidine synthase n=1 Tax=Uabimicrobium amorphum TaxID=2596890 RepID=A0A5S9F779_UABAM|nr:fused MFS/spermidine synthase [Candidatus Uabimicrobium amorphum]BBM87334.1 spermidine synthase [Candidatus Uabimicrobium amorphum]
MNKSIVKWVALLLFFSGGCSLSYQILWRKLLIPVMGGSTWATTTILATFMTGLALGSFYSEKIRTKNPLRVYGYLELAIAVYSVVALWIFPYASWLLAPLYSLIDANFIFFIILQFLVAFLLFVIPSFLMGITLPMLVFHFSQQKDLFANTATLYAANTFGAALGVVFATFVLLPWCGITYSAYMTSLLSAGIAMSALRMSRHSHCEVPQSTAATWVPDSLCLWAFMCGAIGLFLEISWTRILVVVFGSSTYAFSIILLSILLSIALGSWWVRKFILLQDNYRSFLYTLLCGNILFIALSLYIINFLPNFFMSLTYLCNENLVLFLILQGVTTGIVIFVPMTLLGMLLPVIIEGYKLKTQATSKAVTYVYGYNTLGAIFGSMGAGFFCIPIFGVHASLKFCIYLGCAVLLLTLLKETSRQVPKLLCVVFTALLVFISPTMNVQAFHKSLFRKALVKKEKLSYDAKLIYAEDGINSTVTVYRDFYHTSLNINGKTDASTSQDLDTQYLLGHIPMFLASQSKNVFVLGLGSGATVHAVATHKDAQVDVVEMEEAVITASGYFKAINGNVTKNPRVKIYVEDARTFLKYRDKTYDVMISEPSNPWVEGSGSVFTKEFYDIVNSKLNQGGVFCQWIQGYEISRQTFDTILATLKATFPHVVIFRQDFDFLCIATREPLKLTYKELQNKFVGKELQKTLKRIGIHNPAELLCGLYGSLPDDTVHVQKINRDDNVILEYRAPLEMYRGINFKPQRLKTADYFARLCTYFYSDLSADEAVEKVILALRTLQPEEWPRIKELAKYSKNQAHMEAIASIAEQRHKMLQNKDEMVREAAVLITQGKVQPALYKLEEIISLDPLDPSGYRLLAKIYTRLQKVQLAMTCYEQIVWLAPEDYVSRLNVGLLTYQNGKKEVAEQHMRETFEIYPQYLEGRLAWIALFVNNKEFDKAKDFYRKSLAMINKKDRDEFKMKYIALMEKKDKEKK